MSRLQVLLQDLHAMPGVNGAFLHSLEGVIATTYSDHLRSQKVGRVFLNVMSGFFSLGHFIQEIYCNFDNSVLMIRPVSRGCILAAVCQPDATSRLVDISLAMTVKSIEEELNGLERLPPPLEPQTAEDEADIEKEINDREAGDPEVENTIAIQSEG